MMVIKMKFKKLEFEKLNTLPDRAAYLLKIGVTAKINMIDLAPVIQACIGDGDVWLPVTGDNEAEAIEKGTAWLKEKAAA